MYRNREVQLKVKMLFKPRQISWRKCWKRLSITQLVELQSPRLSLNSWLTCDPFTDSSFVISYGLRFEMWQCGAHNTSDAKLWFQKCIYISKRTYKNQQGCKRRNNQVTIKWNQINRPVRFRAAQQEIKPMMGSFLDPSETLEEAFQQFRGQRSLWQLLSSPVAESGRWWPGQLWVWPEQEVSPAQTPKQKKKKKRKPDSFNLDPQSPLGWVNRASKGEIPVKLWRNNPLSYLLSLLLHLPNLISTYNSPLWRAWTAGCCHDFPAPDILHTPRWNSGQTVCEGPPSWSPQLMKWGGKGWLKREGVSVITTWEMLQSRMLTDLEWLLWIQRKKGDPHPRLGWEGPSCWRCGAGKQRGNCSWICPL